MAFLHIRLSNAYLTSLPYSKWNSSRYCILLERDPTSIVIPSYRRERERELGMLYYKEEAEVLPELNGQLIDDYTRK